MKLNREKQGELFIFIEQALWGLFPVITILSLNKLPPLVALAGSTFFATIFFAFMISLKNKWAEIKNTSVLSDILLATFFIGVLYYLFSFLGLQYTSAGNASIIGLTQVFFSYLFFHVFRKDYVPVQHIWGAILMVAGAFIVLYPNLQSLRIGDLLILSAAAIAPFGNFFTQRARKVVSTETIMFIRSFITTIVIFSLALIFNPTIPFSDLKDSSVFLLINGIFLLGLSKILWVEAIHRIPVMKANALGSVVPLFTLFYAWMLLQNYPTPYQLLSLIPMAFGIILLSKDSKA